MTGAELKLLCTLNNVKTYDIANTIGISHGTMTRLCQPTREIKESTAQDILTAIKKLKGDKIVTSVTLENVADMLKSLD